MKAETRLLRGACLAAALAAAACGGDARTAAPEPQALAAGAAVAPPDTMPLQERQALAGRIVFISERDGNKELYSVRPDGEDERRVTDSPAEDFFGAVLPDGSGVLAISLEGEKEDRVERFRIHPAAGGDPEPLGPPGAWMRNPSWGPDGSWLVFESNTRDGYRDIYRLDRATGAVRALTSNPEGNFRPVVSPNGEWVVFSSSRDSVSELYRMRPDGSGVQRLTHTPRDEWGARWSSDSGLIAFLSDRDGSDRIYLTDPAGSEVRRLTREAPNPHVMEDSPTWSPTGVHIAWVRRESGKPTRILFTDLSTGARGQVQAPGPGELDHPTWSPDGRGLAFTVTRGDSAQVYLARADGTAPTLLTRGAGPNWAPVWMAEP
jgi:TolB protein